MPQTFACLNDGPPLGGGSGHRQEVQDAEQAASEQNGGWQHEEVGRPVPPARTGHCATGQYFQWAKNWTTAKWGWCPYKTQTREHLFKNCPRWEPQQGILWAEARKETGRGGESHFKIRDLFEDERCTRLILDFLRTTDVGRRMEPEAAGKEAQSEASERREGGEE
jgi:hypothetical protein